MLRAQNVGLSIALVPSVMVVMNVVYALAAYPVGVLSDLMGRKVLLAIGILWLVVADIFLALGGTVMLTLIGVGFWGLHMAFTRGLFAILERRGTAFGVINLLAGLATLAARVIAGMLWEQIGAPATFLAGAGFSALTLLGLILFLAVCPAFGVADVDFSNYRKSVSCYDMVIPGPSTSGRPRPLSDDGYHKFSSDERWQQLLSLRCSRTSIAQQRRLHKLILGLRVARVIIERT